MIPQYTDRKKKKTWRDGDRVQSRGEWFTFWRGQWRRDSELEDFPSYQRYLEKLRGQ